MDNKEAIYRIQDHMRIHRLYEPNAVFINEALNLAIKALHEQKNGVWLPVLNGIDDDTNPAWDCSECDVMVSKEYPYCPRCGAKMEKEEKDR